MLANRLLASLVVITCEAADYLESQESPGEVVGIPTREAISQQDLGARSEAWNGRPERTHRNFL